VSLKLLLLSSVVVNALFVCPSKLFAQSSSAVTLAWNSSPSPSTAGYSIAYGTATGIYPTSTDVGNQTTATIPGLSAGQTYFFVVTAYDVAGQKSPPSNEVNYQVPSASPSLPAPWQTVGIGNPAGSASESNGAYTVQGAGTISGSADAFRFVYQTLSGDGEIKVRVNSVDQTGTAARSGVMIRETLAGGSRYAFMGITPAGSFRWQYRTKTGANSSASTSGTGLPPNAWLRLTRTGNTLYGYKSADGTNWTKVGSRSVVMATNIYFGLAVASGASNTVNTSTFMNVLAAP
jgi:hypothetical protein